MSRTPRAMILAAGFGTRLGSLSERCPKPMLPICGVPLVRWTVLWLRHHGIREIVVNLHHLGELIEAELGDGAALGVHIEYSRESGQILGTGGGLRKARPLLDDGKGTPIVVVNGKILIDLDLREVVARHRDSAAEATMVLRRDPNARDWGSFRLDEHHRIVEFLQATPERAEVGSPVTDPLMFTGVHVIDPRFLDRVPPEGEQCIVRTAYRSLFHEGGALLGYEARGYWWEHSTPQRYLQGVENVLSGRVELPYAPFGTRGIDPTAHVHASAEVIEPVWIGPHAEVAEGARVGPFVQLGRGARVRAGIRLERCVVWDGVEVERDSRDEICS